MPCLTDLSNELLFEILQYLPPTDLGSFYCVNKHVYVVTTIHRIRYQSLKRRFAASLNTMHPGSPARHIKSVLADPEAALYVQHYIIDGCRSVWNPTNGGHDYKEPNQVEYTASDVAQLRLALGDLNYLSIDETEAWIEYLMAGEEPNLIALALTLFPNLTSIDVHASNTFEYQAFSQVISLLKTMALRTTDEKRAGGPFAKLISVNIEFGPDYSFLNDDVIEVFAALPMVKIVNAEGLHGEGRLLEMNSMPTRCSNVTDLNMHGDISPRRLMFLLQSFERLQSFTYIPERGSHFEPTLIVTVLLACAQDSLRELEIRATSAPYMGSLRRFRVLEYLEIDSNLMFGDSGSKAQNFQTCLPPSIREVKLHGWGTKIRDSQARIANLIQSRQDFPNLRSIEVWDTVVCEPYATDISRICAAVDISLTFVDNIDVLAPAFTRRRTHYAQRQAKKVLTEAEVI